MFALADSTKTTVIKQEFRESSPAWSSTLAEGRLDSFDERGEPAKFAAEDTLGAGDEVRLLPRPIQECFGKAQRNKSIGAIR